MLDEGKGASNASRATRPPAGQEPFWLPGDVPALCTFNRIFENRVRVELEELGVLHPDDVDPISERIRLDSWHLRNIAAASADSVRYDFHNHYSDLISKISFLANFLCFFLSPSTCSSLRFIAVISHRTSHPKSKLKHLDANLSANMTRLKWNISRK